MKIAHLLSGFDIALNNDENEFVKKHGTVKLESLDDKDLWLAQNLVRKGIYEISKDNKFLIKRLDENN